MLRRYPEAILLIVLVMIGCSFSSRAVARDGSGGVPGVPTGLTATVVSSSQINLKWNAVTKAAGYTVQRSLNGTSGWVLLTWTTSTSFSNFLLLPSTTYYYRVNASNLSGQGSFCSPVSATTLGTGGTGGGAGGGTGGGGTGGSGGTGGGSGGTGGGTGGSGGTNPGTPGALTPSALIATAASSTEVNLTWIRERNDETGIIVQRQTGSGPFQTIATLPAGSNIWTDISCYPSQTYTYQLIATYSTGPSNPTTPSTATTSAPVAGGIADPTNPSVVATSPTTATFSFTDNATNQSNKIYIVERSDDGISFHAIGTCGFGNSGPYYDTVLQPGHTYLYRTRAGSTATGPSNYTQPVAVTMPSRASGMPLEPSGSSVTLNSANSVTINWVNNDGSAIKVERAVWGYGTSFGFTQITQTAPGATSYTDNTMQPETPYVYRVRATNANGDSGYDAIVYVTTASVGSGGKTWDIGPGYAYPSIGSFDWTQVGPGDTVQIHCNKDASGNIIPYYELLLISTRGTPANPIHVTGIPDPTTGTLPILDGTNAVVPSQFKYGYPPVQGSIITINPRSGQNYGYRAGYIVISNLELRNAWKGATGTNTFTGFQGDIRTYSNSSMGVYLLNCDNITLKNLNIHGNGEGIFGAGQSTYDRYMENITVDSCHIWGNGNIGSYLEHEIYIECVHPVYQYNWIQAERAGAVGSSLKDRSVAPIIRYNWIEASARILDLVDSQNEIDLALAHPEYHTSFVYGNVMINNNPLCGNLIHYGGDQGTPIFERKGVLYAWNNTVISTLASSVMYSSGLFQLDNPCETVDARNNILYFEAPTGLYPSELALLPSNGIGYFGVNWVSPNWTNCRPGTTFTGLAAGTFQFLNSTGNNPGFVSTSITALDPHLTAGSPCISQSGTLSQSLAGFILSAQYQGPNSAKPRTLVGTVWDLGAFEYGN